MMIIFWTAGCIGTFALIMATDMHNQAAEAIQVFEPGMPLWALQGGIAVGCVFLWPVLLIAMVLDWMRGDA